MEHSEEGRFARLVRWGSSRRENLIQEGTIPGQFSWNDFFEYDLHVGEVGDGSKKAFELPSIVERKYRQTASSETCYSAWT